MIASKSTQRKIKTIPGIANQHAAPTRTPSLSAPITEVASKLIVDSIDSEIQFDNDIEMTDSEPSLVEAGTKRLTTMHEIEYLKGPAMKRVKNEKPDIKKATKPKYSNKDLPSGCHADDLWCRVLIPTLAEWFGRQSNPFDVPEAETLAALQTIWDKVLGECIPHCIEIGDAIWDVAKQRITEWRSGFAKTALTALDANFDSVDEFKADFKARSVAATAALENEAFLYEHVEDPANRASLSCGHSDDDMKPKGAVALSAAAVERAYKLFATCCIEKKKGKLQLISKANKATGWDSTMDISFSGDIWSDHTYKYFKKMIQKKLHPSSIDKIITGAKQYVKGGSRGSGSSVTTKEDDLSGSDCSLDDILTEPESDYCHLIALNLLLSSI
ncbi:hypothetical protein PAXINDRAFT_157910 [Paxillus involutus ATCC 200175]|uniref:Uncharacterized protein n=1 Tax=Paxillus involutus ATCC 200175 TaxID=664439 RepID=A0A0C9TQA7_PAXIN|nr:hypothetical protein PAXINDRAFT_157910 [Paxillus involutus ATCC 200175]